MSQFQRDLLDLDSQGSVATGTYGHSTSRLATHEGTYDALILDARLRQSLAAVRSLGSRGLRVAALGNLESVPTFSSRWCQQAFLCSAEEGAEMYLPYLERALERTRARVLITSSDATIALIRRHRERLEQQVRLALASEPALGIALSKEQTLETAQHLGIGVPQSIRVGAVNEVREALHEVGLPVVIKPVESWVWRSKEQGLRLECKLVTTPEEAEHEVETLAHLGVKVFFQQFLSGRRESVSFLYANGRMYARYAQWHMRSYPPLGGQSVLRQSIAVPADIGDQAERLVREIGLEGCSEVEFRRDNAGKPYLMEINPRLWLATELAVRSGVDFPYLLYQWASGGEIDDSISYPVGARLRHVRLDLVTTLTAVRQRGRPEVLSPTRAILAFCLAFFVPTGYDYLHWQDLRPAWLATAGFARYVLRGIKKRLLRRKPR